MAGRPPLEITVSRHFLGWLHDHSYATVQRAALAHRTATVAPDADALYTSPAMALLDRDTILEALTRLNGHLARRGERAELFLVGGAVMCLVHKARPATKDVDAWFTAPQAVRDAARAVAEEMRLDENWLNDAAKAFLPSRAAYETWKAMSHLTISTVDPRTLLAMKCAAARTEVDTADIRFLANLLGLRSAAAVLEVVLDYFPTERLPVRTRLLLEEMFDDGA